MEREGINLWKQIGETLADEIGNGALAPGERLPASVDLATRFGVNQHTVLRAISHLQSEGLVRIERGRGTYVAETIPYRMGRRDRFEENLKELNRAPSRQLLSVAEITAPPMIAGALALASGETVTLVTVLAIADEIPISLNQNYFPNSRLPGIANAYRVAAAKSAPDLATKSVLAPFHLSDFARKTIRIRGRDATPDEIRYLRMAPQDSVFEVEVVNIDGTGVPIVFGHTSFCLSRVEFFWDFADGELA